MHWAESKRTTIPWISEHVRFDPNFKALALLALQAHRFRKFPFLSILSWSHVGSHCHKSHFWRFSFDSLHTGGVDWGSCVRILGLADTKQLWLGLDLAWLACLACLLGLVIRSETANGWFWNCALHFARMARLADNFVYLRVLWDSITCEMMTEL